VGVRGERDGESETERARLRERGGASETGQAGRARRGERGGESERAPRFQSLCDRQSTRLQPTLRG